MSSAQDKHKAIGARVHLLLLAFFVATSIFLSFVLLQMSGKDTASIRVVLPDHFHAVAGDTFQLFYRGIVEHPMPYCYDIEVRCDIGMNTARYFEVTPTVSQVGDHPLTVNIRDQRGNIIASAHSLLRVHSVGKSPAVQKNVLCVGDSLTEAGLWCQEVLRRLTESDGIPAGNGLTNIRFIGTRGTGKCRYEGYGGWSWDSYLAAPETDKLDMWVYCSHDKDDSDIHSLWQDSSGNMWSLETVEKNRIKFSRHETNTEAMPVGAGTLNHRQNGVHHEAIRYTGTACAESNPFWDANAGRIDFKTYCERNGFEGIDCMVTLLTWNTMSASYEPDHDKNNDASKKSIRHQIKKAKNLFRIFHEQFPNAKIKMLGLQLPSLNGGCGQSYGAKDAKDGESDYSNWFGLVRAVFDLNLAFQALANEDEFKNYVEFVNLSAQFDSEHNMPHAGKPVNTRSSVMEEVGTNGLHPSIEGYYQIGDAAYRALIPELTE